MLDDTLLAVAYATLCWWLGTGIILWLDRLPQRSFRWSLSAWSVLLALSFWGVVSSMQSRSAAAAYISFGSVIVMWGWHELAFLTGWLTGWRKQPLQANATGWLRLRQSVAVIIYHELGLLLNLIVLWLIQGDQPNRLAFYTFAMLWCLRVSGKLNLYFGVPENGAQYLPKHLAYLASYFPKGGLNAWFVLSISFALAAWFWIVGQAQIDTSPLTIGWVLLAALLGLGILEHAMMMLPWPLERIWGWALNYKSRNQNAVDKVRVNSK